MRRYSLFSEFSAVFTSAGYGVPVSKANLDVKWPSTPYSLLPQFSMSRVYTLTVMVTLLARDDLRKSLLEGTHASLATTIRDTNRTAETVIKVRPLVSLECNI